MPAIACLSCAIKSAISFIFASSVDFWSWDVAFDPVEVRPIIKKHNETVPQLDYGAKSPACGKT
ncbi:MAG: hypothetical protein ACKOCQ_04175, partial [Candidatus Nitrosotenuis sp.]